MRYHSCDFRLLVFLAVGAWAGVSGGVAAQAPYVDSRAIRERFATVTPEDMSLLREKKILLVSRSFGLNLVKGLTALARENPQMDLVASYERFNVFQAGGDVGIVPADIFDRKRFVHVLGTYHPHTKRLEELDALLKNPPQALGDKVDAVVVFYHYAQPALFDTYARQMEAWRAAYPGVRFIFVTSGFMGPKYAKNNEESFAFGEKVREAFRGKVPLYDMGAILSDDFRVGHVYCPEYSKDPAEVHPNDPAGEAALAKGFLLVLKEAFAQPPPPVAGGAGPPATAPATETLPATHPDARAVRAILDANGLRDKKVEGVSVVRGGRVVELFLQEGGLTVLPDAVGQLTALRKLHLYGDRSLGLPLLKSLSPALGKCTELEELLLTQNDLTTLPAALVGLEKLKNLSLAENRLSGLPPAVEAWAKRFDPKGLADQQPDR